MSDIALKVITIAHFRDFNECKNNLRDNSKLYTIGRLFGTKCAYLSLKRPQGVLINIFIALEAKYIEIG